MLKVVFTVRSLEDTEITQKAQCNFTNTILPILTLPFDLCCTPAANSMAMTSSLKSEQ